MGLGTEQVKKAKIWKFWQVFRIRLFLKNPGDISFDVPDNTTIVVKGIDKQRVGQISSEIRGIRKPEPYKGKGIKYADEIIRRKVGKAAASAK